MGEAVIIDDFLSGFESFRDSLDSHIFSGVKSPVDDIFYSGVSADVPKSVSDNIKSKLDSYFGNVEIKFQFMRISQEGVFAPHEAHNDASMADYSMMLYLNRLEDCQGGTSFVSHIEEGMKFGPIDDKQFNIWESDNKDQSKWFVDDMAEMKPNRAVIFESDRMHRSEPVGGFGKTTKDARLVLVTFFNANP